MGVGSKQRDEAQRAKDVGDRKQWLCQQGGVPDFPIVPGYMGSIRIALLKKKQNNDIKVSFIWTLTFFYYKQKHILKE